MFMAWVVWITGLPGSGKSTVAFAVKQKIPDAVLLQSDKLREFVIPDPKYTGDEREYVYKALVYTAKTVYELGHNVIIDATANWRLWRDLARKIIPNYFEVYLKCSIEVCKERERTRKNSHGAPEGIYTKGEQGAPVPGVNVPYEEPLHPELIIDMETILPEEAAEKIVRLVLG